MQQWLPWSSQPKCTAGLKGRDCPAVLAMSSRGVQKAARMAWEEDFTSSSCRNSYVNRKVLWERECTQSRRSDIHSLTSFA